MRATTRAKTHGKANPGWAMKRPTTEARIAALEARIEAALDQIALDRKALKRLRSRLAPQATVPPAQETAKPPRKPAAKSAPAAPQAPSPRPAKPRAPRRKTHATSGGPGAMRALQRAQERLEALGVKPYRKR